MSKKSIQKPEEMQKNNISDISNCYGCGVCAAVCPKKIIDIRLNRDGFYEPFLLNEKDCINCGICMDVCSFRQDERALQDSHPLQSWAAWSQDDNVRKKCSSGGIGFEIGRQLISKGYQVVGCRYNTEHQRAEHYIAITVEDLIQSIGSKYIQSFTLDAFKKIQRKNAKYLVTGTPCQIDSFRRMIQKFHCEDNFVLMDFYCHCVPSMWVWRSYLRMLEPKLGKITYASWRNKFEFGWHDSWLMGLDGENTATPVNWHDSYNMLIRGKKTHYQCRMTKGDLFYRLFLGDIALGPQCEKQCKYKYDRSSADLRIGDLWGNTYKKDEKGVSALVAFTEKGRNVVKELTGVQLIEHPFSIVSEGQMRSNAHHKEMSAFVKLLLRHNFALTSIPFRIVLFTQRLITKINTLL